MRLNELVKKEQEREIQRFQQQKLEKKLNKASEWSTNNTNNTILANNDNEHPTINKSHSAHNLNSSTIHKSNKYVLTLKFNNTYATKKVNCKLSFELSSSI